jgi:hypothetical protein
MPSNASRHGATLKTNTELEYGAGVAGSARHRGSEVVCG